MGRGKEGKSQKEKERDVYLSNSMLFLHACKYIYQDWGKRGVVTWC